eukprot:scaffold6403_cov128-Skeletonema_dohrnii-CCMP3373.AAC.16
MDMSHHLPRARERAWVLDRTLKLLDLEGLTDEPCTYLFIMYECPVSNLLGCQYNPTGRVFLYKVLVGREGKTLIKLDHGARYSSSVVSGSSSATKG